MNDHPYTCPKIKAGGTILEIVSLTGKRVHLGLQELGSALGMVEGVRSILGLTSYMNVIHISGLSSS